MADLTPFEEQLLLAEYNALNGDIQRRLAVREALVGIALSSSLALAGISGVPGEALLAFPWAIYGVSRLLLHHEIGTKRKTAYLREVESRCFPKGFGFLSQKKRIIESSPVLSTDGLDIESVINRMLVGSQVGAIAFGWFRLLQAPLSPLVLIFASVLSLLALVAVMLTLRSDYARRQRKHAARQKAEKAAESAASPVEEKVSLAVAKGEIHAAS